MIRELDTVVLKHDIEAHRLKEGDLGAVVHCYRDGEAFEVDDFLRGSSFTPTSAPTHA